MRDYQSDVVVPVDTKTFWSQSSSFRQRQKQYPRTRFTLKLAKPLEFAACAELLSATAAKVSLSSQALPIDERKTSRLITHFVHISEAIFCRATS